MSRAEWERIVESLAPASVEAGFDLVQPFAVSTYNARASSAHRLPDFERADALGIVIGNTSALWPAFLRAYRGSGLRRELHPLDAYVTRSLTDLVTRTTSRRTELIFAHVTTPRAFPIQRVAESAGLAALSPSHLVIHPIHGPWLALRAVVVIDVSGPEAATAAARPCDTCSAPCVPALERALVASGPKLDSQSVSANARAWIAVRDACPIGRASRYGEDQLRYHYEKVMPVEGSD